MLVEFANPLEAALTMTRLGCSVIPLRERAKIPAIAWKGYCEKPATGQEVRAWFDEDPGRNVGLVCGAVSGLAVIDIDGIEGEVWFREHGLPMSPLRQTTSGPHKHHLIYRHPGKGYIVRPSVDTTVKVDIRGDGSQIVMAPSIHPNGATYQMYTAGNMTLEEALAALPMMPEMFVEREGESHAAPATGKGDVAKGGRNSGLTSQCGTWYARGLGKEEVLALAHAWNRSHCQPPLPDKEVETIAMSMAGTHAGRNPGLLNTDGVAGWLKKVRGSFTLADAYRDLGATLAADRAQIRLYLEEQVKDGRVEEKEGKHGLYRKKSSKVERIDLSSDEGKPLDIWLPFGLHKSTFVYPGNVIVVAGETNSGKTSLMLDIVRHNRKHIVRYLSSEMTVTELKGRLRAFGDPLTEWENHCEFIQRSEDFADVIYPHGINVIDFMEMSGDFYRVNEYITNIFRKLQDGIAIVCLQKKRGEMFGRGGEFGLEKARLGLSLFSHGHLPKGVFGSCIVTKAKNIRTSNPQGKECFYRLIDGATYKTGLLESCPTIREGLAYYSPVDRKKIVNEIDNFCQAEQSICGTW